MSQQLVFRYGRSRITLNAAAALLGGAVVVLAIAQSLPWWLAVGGLVIIVAALLDATRPVYILDDEGILLARSGGGTYRGFRPTTMVRWSSVRDVQRVGQDIVALCLPGDTWIRLRIGGLSEAERDQLLQAIHERAVFTART